MTAALLAAAIGLLLWSRSEHEYARADRLRADGRLSGAAAPITTPFGGSAPVMGPAGGLSSAASVALRVVSGLSVPALLGVAGLAGVAIALAVFGTSSRSSADLVASVEFALCTSVVTLTSLAVLTQVTTGRQRLDRQSRVSLAVGLLAGELEAGAAPARALAAEGAMGAEIARQVRDEHAGHDHDPLTRVALAWRVSERSGVPLGVLLARVRTDLADQRATDREVSAAVAGPQASATVLALLPLLGVALGSAMGGRPIAVLFDTPAGRLLLCAGVALDALGVWWTMRLIASARR